MAAMSVIGIDFGNESCYVAVARAGGIETIANDYSLRGTPACVSFTEKTRAIGVAALNQMVTNMRNTVVGFKRLLGRKYNDPQAQKELKSLCCLSSQRPDGSIGIHVNYLDEEHIFTPEQITAMLFTKLKDISESALQTAVNDCVISVPSYFTQAERQALLDAARIAGLNVLRLLNETTATALCYGIYKQDLPAPEAAPRNVVFVDCGYASLQVSVCAFHKGKLKMLATAFDSNLGGRDIDEILADHFAKEFQAKYNVDAKKNPRAYLRLRGEVERLKKQMSANSTSLPVSIECFLDECDVYSHMKRADMEALCSHLFKRVEHTLKQCLADSKLKPEEIHSVELAGGSSRVPAIKRLVEEVFGRPISTTLNQDESVARGCALQCAMLSPAVRVRDFSVTDIQPYPIKLTWDANQGEEGEMEVFGHNHPVPFSKLLTFYRSNSFSLTASYSTPLSTYPQQFIGNFVIKNVKPSPEGESSKVRVKVRINLNGILTITSASLVEKREPTQQEKEEEEKQQQEQQQNNMDIEQQQQQEAKDKADQEAQANEHVPEVSMDKTRRNSDADDGEKDAKRFSTSYYSSKIRSWFGSGGEDKNEDGDKKKKVLTRIIDLPVEATVSGLSQKDLDAAIEKECKMVAQDKQENERIDARNALEEYVYDVRAKVAEGESLSEFVTDADRIAITKMLTDTEVWLYEDGDNCQRQVYIDRLTQLKLHGEPIKERKREFEGRQFALDEFSAALQIAEKSLDLIKLSIGKDDKYSHLTEDEIKKVEKTIREKSAWLEEKRYILAGTPRTQTATITVAQIKQEKQSLDDVVQTILNKPKPQVEAPKEEKSKDKAADDKSPKSKSQSQEGQQQNNQQQAEEKMDVD